MQYDLDLYNRKLKQFIDSFDPTGTLGVLYAKNLFTWVIKKTNVPLSELINDPDCIADSREMYQIFNCEHVTEIEKQFTDAVDQSMQRVVGSKFISSGDAENRDPLIESLDPVVEQLIECKHDIFSAGEVVKSVDLCPNIYVFNTLAECLLTLEQSADGLYLCYVSADGGPAGFFGFYLKSGSNLLSVSERLDEHYIGEFSHHRNHRFADRKKYRLFPYELVEFSGYDYKGYAAHHTIKSSKFSLKDLSPESYMPVLIAAVLINIQYEGTVLTDERKYVDSLLSVNLPQLTESNDLPIKIQSSALVRAHSDYYPSMTHQEVLHGTKYKENSRCFPVNSEVIDTWCDGFSGAFAAADALRRKPAQLKLTDGSITETYNLEAVGDKARMDMLYYIGRRAQLAAYVRRKMYEAYDECGGDTYINNWFHDVVHANADKLLQKFVEYAAKIKVGLMPKHKFSFYGVPTSPGLEHSLFICEYPSRVSRNMVVNEVKPNHTNSDTEYRCYVSNCTANVFLNCQF